MLKYTEPSSQMFLLFSVLMQGNLKTVINLNTFERDDPQGAEINRSLVVSEAWCNEVDSKKRGEL